MERVTDIKQLKFRDKIVRVCGGKPRILEFLCIHPCNDAYSIFMNENKDGDAKFYNNRLSDEEWYRFTDSDDDWDEIYDMEIAWHKKCIQKVNSRKRKKVEEEEIDLWMRLGILLHGSDEDITKVCSGDEDTLVRLLKEKKFTIDGETYIPDTDGEEVEFLLNSVTIE